MKNHSLRVLEIGSWRRYLGLRDRKWGKPARNSIMRSLMISNPHQISCCVPFCGASTPFRIIASLTGLHDYTHCRTTLGRTPPDEWSARYRDPYLETQNTHKKLTCMPSAKFEPEIPVSERPQIRAFDRAVTGSDTSNRSRFMKSIGMGCAWHVTFTK
jgi:hypothetical protein